MPAYIPTHWKGGDAYSCRPMLYRGARVASQPRPILRDSTYIIHKHAGIHKAINPKDLQIVDTTNQASFLELNLNFFKY